MKLRSIFRVTILSLFIIISTQVFSKTNSSVNDSVITSKIMGKIALDQTISVFNIGVTTNNGEVFLSGVVDSDSQAEDLLDLVQSTDGVKKTNTDDLSVKNSNHPIKDMLITTQVKLLLLKQRALQNINAPVPHIHVETNNGVVYLIGTVRSQSQIFKAVNAAKSIDGVKRVESRLKIVSVHG